MTPQPPDNRLKRQQMGQTPGQPMAPGQMPMGGPQMARMTPPWENRQNAQPGAAGTNSGSPPMAAQANPPNAPVSTPPMGGGRMTPPWMAANPGGTAPGAPQAPAPMSAQPGPGTFRQQAQQNQNRQLNTF